MAIFSESTTSALVGKTVDGGALRLAEVLGTGGFGVVYRAVNIADRDDKQYAVKVIAKRFRTSQWQQQLRELELHSRVSDHPNIVTLHRSFADVDHLFFVFDACLGGDLFSSITEKALYFYNDNLTKQVFVQIIDAVQYCHSQGIFHRDLKPENILCSADGSHVYLTDFGLATESNISTTFGIGSSFYMSPEIIRKDLKLDRYSPRYNDIWALGMIFINMTTGRSPWRSAVCSDDCFAAYLHDPDFLRSMLPLSKPACALIRRVLVLNPLTRIGLDEFRAEILNIDTFFMSRSELRKANRHVREIVEAYLNLSAISPVDQTSNFEPVVEHDIAEMQPGVAFSPVDSEEQYAFDSPDPDYFAPLKPAVVPVYKSSSDSLHAPDLLASPTLNPSSTASTKGPITPETRAVQDVDIVDAARSIESLSLPQPVAQGQPNKGDSHPVVDFSGNPAGKEKPSRPRMFSVRQAMQKLHIL